MCGTYASCWRAACSQVRDDLTSLFTARHGDSSLLRITPASPILWRALAVFGCRVFLSVGCAGAEDEFTTWVSRKMDGYELDAKEKTAKTRARRY